MQYNSKTPQKKAAAEAQKIDRTATQIAFAFMAASVLFEIVLSLFIFL